jgi:hypothetical protein
MHVIVVAFGPHPVTKWAVQRARRYFGGAVTVVAATPSVRLRRGMIPGADIVPESGTHGIRRVLQGLWDEPVLIIHDDAALTPRGAATLAATYQGGFVVPHSNEQGTAQHIGALPRSNQADACLDALTLSRENIDEARVSCIVGPASLLASSGGSLVVPGSMVQGREKTALAPCAVAHDLRCNTRLDDADGGVGEPPLLVATMIVRDEEERIGEALASLRPIVDRIEICDTGSTDRTIEIALAHGANVREIEWKNDFGWARNRALETCRDAEFVIFVDADERVRCDDPILFRRWLRTWRHEIDGLNTKISSSRGKTGAATEHVVQRIARAKAVRFEGALHETMRYEDDATRGVPIVSWYRGLSLDHHGYLPHVIAGRNKPERNAAISRAAYETNPTVKTRIDLARSLRMIDDGDTEAERLFRETLEELDERAPAQTRAFVEATVATYEMQAGELDEAVRLSLNALERVSGEDLARATLAQCLVALGRHAELVEHDARLATVPTARSLFSIARNQHRYEASVGRALIETGQPSGLDRLMAAFRADPAATVDIATGTVPLLCSAGGTEEALLELLQGDGSGQILAVIARHAAPATTALLCGAAVSSGSTNKALRITGLTAGLLKQIDSVIEPLLRDLSSLDDDERLGLADLARRQGRLDVATVLEDGVVETLTV